MISTRLSENLYRFVNIDHLAKFKRVAVPAVLLPTLIVVLTVLGDSVKNNDISLIGKNYSYPVFILNYEFF